MLHRISHWNGRPLPPGQLAADKPRQKAAGEQYKASWHRSTASLYNSVLPVGKLCLDCSPSKTPTQTLLMQEVRLV